VDEFEQKLKEAQEAGARMMASATQGTRPHNIAMNHLETAQLWARYDREEKERNAQVAEAN
jgi:hypothetical protein